MELSCRRYESVIFYACQKPLEKYFFMKDDFVFYSEVGGLLEDLNIKHIPEKWRLFIDASGLILRAELLHNGNQLPSILNAYAAHFKESYGNLKLLSSIEYNSYKWQVCGDLKVIAILTGHQHGYIVDSYVNGTA